VYLVGAGPGDPKLITVKGLEALKRAEVVVYDHLISEQLLDQAGPTARLIYVGKEKGRHARTQTQINRLLVRTAKAGRIVVRLKGGDPMLFGRGGEEALALVHAKIPYEIVPGVTSAIAVPAYAGIPVTHRGVSSSVSIITGHEDPSKTDTTIPWKRLAASSETLVCLMGVGALVKTVDGLIRYGRSKTTPCAVIEWGTLPRQRTIVGTLSTIASRCERLHLKPPAVIVIGQVVKLRDRLNWFERKRLFGLRIAVTRPLDRADRLAELLQGLGAEVVTFPTIELVSTNSNGLFKRCVDRIEKFDWVFFTSPEGIHWFQRLLAAQRKDLRVLGGRQIGAIGPKTASSIQELGIRVDVVPRTYSQEGLLEGLKPRRLAGQRALILSAQGSRNVLEQGLRAKGMEVVRVPLYRTVIPSSLRRHVRGAFSQPFDYVTVTSSSCVDHLAQALRACGFSKVLRRLRFASIGPVTSSAVRRAGGRVAVEARVSTVEGLVETITRAVRPRT